MFEQYSSLIFKGKAYKKSALLELCQAKLNSPPTDWESALYGFIVEWLDETQPHIKVKTSGSTGTPKTILLKKDIMIQSARMTLDFLKIKRGANTLLCLSCNYIAGKMMVVRAFVGGLNLIPTEPASDPLKNLTEEQKIDFTAWVSMQLQNALQPHSLTVQNIDNILIGGAPVNYPLRKQIGRLSNNIYETYGMTETVSHIALKLLSKGADETYFTTLENITVEKDERGCLVIHAHQLSDKPVITNDLVEIKDKKHFQWLGRYDNVVNSGGIKLIPELLERKIEHLFDQRFFFAGLPDEKLGEKLVLVVEGKEDESDPVTSIHRITSKLQNILDKYEMPKEILFRNHFRETSSGKVDRRRTMSIRR